MQYVQYIETSQTWVCPKTGRWKVIAVGGGCSGGRAPSYEPVTGGTTSFGTIISAGGGASMSTDTTNVAVSGGAGAIKTTIVDIEENQEIACTIGAGGTAPRDECSSGADGVIILEYLGV